MHGLLLYHQNDNSRNRSIENAALSKIFTQEKFIGSVTKKASNKFGTCMYQRNAISMYWVLYTNQLIVLVHINRSRLAILKLNFFKSSVNFEYGTFELFLLLQITDH